MEALDCQNHPIIRADIRTEVSSHYPPHIVDSVAGDEDKHHENTKESGVAVQVTGKQLVCGG